MVSLTFDASTFEPKIGDITISVGANKSHLRWSDRRTLSFAALAEILTKPAIGNKDGSCYTPAIFRMPNRRMDLTDQIDIAVLDSDCGHTAGEIIQEVKARGWVAIVHSTFSHLTNRTAINAKAYDKWRTEFGDDVGAYMRAKKSYLPRVVEGAQIVDENGDNYIVEHAPCPKFRVVLHLSAPWVAADYASQQIANATWGVRLKALAASLHLHADESCKDTSRLFYFPRIRNAEQPFFGTFLDGDLCDIWSLPEASDVVEGTPDAPNLFNAPAARARPAPMAPGSEAHVTFTDPETGEVVDLTTWAVNHGPRFEVVKAMKARGKTPFGPRNSRGKHHFCCAFDDEHTQAGDRSGTYAVNSSDLKGAGLSTFHSGFFIGCSHASCKGRDRLAHLKRILEPGWLLVADLTDEQFLVPDTSAHTPEQMREMVSALENQDKARAGKPTSSGSVPPHLMESLPGVMGSIHRYILATSVKPQPILALGATLAAMAAVVGRKVELDLWGTRPNIYCLGIATTGAGKDRPLTGIKDIFRKSGHIQTLVGAEEVSSDSGIANEARDKPSHVMLIDEIGYLLTVANAKFAPPHLAGVISLLLKLYSQSKTVYKSKSYVERGKVFTIVEPSVSMYAASTPSKLFSAITSDDISGGLLSRVVVFDAGTHNPLGAPPVGAEVPRDAVDWVRAWVPVPLNENAVAMDSGLIVIVPKKVGLTPGARRAFDSFNSEMHHKMIAGQGSGMDGIFVRANENALKFALLHAVSLPPKCISQPITDPDGKELDAGKYEPSADMLVTDAGAQWAIALSRSVTDHMLGIAREHIADTPFGRLCGDFRAAIKRAGARGATVKELSKLGKLKVPTKDWEAATGFLQSSGEIAWGDVNDGKLSKTGYPIKKRDAWIWVDESKKQGDDENE